VSAVENELVQKHNGFMSARRHRDEAEEELEKALAVGMTHRDRSVEMERDLVQLQKVLAAKDAEWREERRALETVMQETVDRLKQSQAMNVSVAELRGRVQDMEAETDRAEAEQDRLVKLVASQKVLFFCLVLLFFDLILQKGDYCWAREERFDVGR
jgi:predicted Mrr-cat superfamily restriction endonuclease